MEEIVRAFGLDVRLIIIQMVNFGVLTVFLWYFLYTPILTILNERQAKIKQGVRDAEAASASRQQAESEKQAVLARAHAEATEIVARGAQHAEARGAEIIQNAEAHAARLIEDARAKGKELQLEARRESEAEIARVAVLTAEKLLRERLDS